jgi:predicted MFS family arabinose efflux permease
MLVSGPGWRWIFLLNVPVGLVTLLATGRLSESRAPRPRPADLPGAALLTAGLLAGLLGLIRGNAEGWTSASILLRLGLGAVLLLGFVLRQRLARAPMVDLGLFRSPRYAGAAVAVLTISGALVGATYFIALYLQNALGFSALDAGLRVLPLTLSSFAAAPLTAALLRRTGTTWPTLLSLVLSAGGLALMSRVDGAGGWTDLVPGMIVSGLGLGVSSAALTAAALSAVEPARAGMATGVINTLRQVGVAAGVAGFGSVFENVAGHRMRDLVAPLADPTQVTALADAVGSGAGRLATQGAPSAVRAELTRLAVDASAAGLDRLLAAGTLITIGAVVALVALIVVERRRPSGNDPVTADSAPVD